MDNKKYIIYAVIVTAVFTLVCWINMFASASDSNGYYRSYGSGGSSYGGGGGHK